MKMLRTLFAVFFFIFAFTFTAMAQGTPDEANRYDVSSYLQQNSLTPPSPQAASIGKYGNLPVNYFTGSVDLTIPLHTVAGQRLSVPISLKYDNSSVKVANMPAWVGLGWSLIAEGVVTRTARSLPDTYNYFTWESQFPAYAGMDTDLSCNNLIDYQLFAYRVAAGDIDLQPDVFSFNFPGGSGSFIFTKDKQIIQRDRSNLKIDPVFIGSDISSFTITTSTGVRYVFSATEETRYGTPTPEQTTDARLIHIDKDFIFNSSWFLTAIYSPDGSEHIELDYQGVTGENCYTGPEINISSDDYVTCTATTENGNTTPYNCTPHTVGNANQEEITPKIYNRKFLKYIRLYQTGDSAPIEEVEFFKTSYPLEVSSGVKLDKFTVKKRWKQALIKDFEIDFDYDNNGDGSENGADDITGRLTLGKVNTHGFDLSGTITHTLDHSFSYYPGMLPAPISNNIDFWGYHTANSKNFLAPSYIVNGQQIYNGADRQAGGSTVGVLESITYPTKGTTNFEYEPHRATNLNSTEQDNYGDKIGGLRIKRIVDLTENGQVGSTRTFQYKDEANSESGKLLNKPEFYTTSTFTNHNTPSFPNPIGGPWAPCSDCDAFEQETITIHSSDSRNFVSIYGSHIGYSRVEEIIGEGVGNIGKNVYYYNYNTSGGLWQATNGTLQKKETYSNTNQKYVGQLQDPDPATANSVNYSRLEKVETYTYSTDCNLGDCPQIGFFYFRSSPDQDNLRKLCQEQQDGCNGNSYTWYHELYDSQNCYYAEVFKTKYDRDGIHATTVWEHLVSTRTIEYFYESVGEVVVANVGHPTGQQIIDQLESTKKMVKKDETYEYNDTDLTFPTDTYFYNSDGQEYRTTTTYKKDFSGNIKALPEIITKKGGGQIIGGSRTVYFSNGNPKEIYEIIDGGAEVLRLQIPEYEYGRPKRIQYMDFPEETLTWDMGLLISRQKSDWIWEYDYSEHRRPILMIDIDKQEVSYEYDGLGRLEKTIARAGNITGEMDYQIGSSNQITQTTTYSDAPTQTLITKYDGLGRETEKILNGVQKQEYHYDEFGRLIQQTHLVGNLEDLIYEPSPLNRLSAVVYPDGSVVQSKYGATGNPDVNAPGYDTEVGYYISFSIDEIGNITESHSDLLGRQTKVIDAMSGITAFTYKPWGGVESVTPPAGAPYTYTYDARHRMESKTIPDGGTTQYGYADDDLLVRMLDANGNRWSYAYDEYARQLGSSVEENQTGLGSIPSSGVMPITALPDPLTTKDIYGPDNGTIETNKVIQSYLLTSAGGSITTDFTYDPFGRVEYQEEDIALGDGKQAQDNTTFTLNHADWLLSSEQDQTFSGNTYTISEGFLYDNFGRILSNGKSVNAMNIPWASVGWAMQYNDRDQMTQKIHGLEDYEVSKYQYDINRGWLRSINQTTPKPSDRAQCGEYPEEPSEIIEIEQEVPATDLLEVIATNPDIEIEGFDPCTYDGGPCEEVLIDYSVEVNQQDFFRLSHPDCIASGFEWSIINLFGTSQVVDLPNYPYLLPNYFTGFGSEPKFDLIEQAIRDWLTTNGYIYHTVEVGQHPRTKVGFFVTIEATNFEFSSLKIEYTSLNCYDSQTNQYYPETLISEFKFEQSNRLTVPCHQLPSSLVINDQNQAASVNTIDQGMSTKTASSLTYPTAVYKVLLPAAGTERWILEEDLPTLEGKYTRPYRVPIKNANQLFTTKTKDGQTTLVTVDGLIDQIDADPVGTDDQLDDIDVEDPVTPDPDCIPTPPTCTEEQQQDQHASLAAIQQDMIYTDLTAADFPYSIVWVQLCDGSTAYIPQDMLDDLVGPYNILDVLVLTDPNETISVIVHKPRDLFSLRLDYEPNGNITHARWKVAHETVKYYNYTYDALNRLTSALYGTIYLDPEYGFPPAAGMDPPLIGYNTVNTLNGNYDVPNISYDAIGNITALSRFGLVGDRSANTCFEKRLIDDLTYDYMPPPPSNPRDPQGSPGNRLTAVTDNASPTYRPEGFDPHFNTNPVGYEYDDNGNLKKETYKDLNFTYNHLNLPTQITGGAGGIIIEYDAAGRKLRQTTSSGATRYYINGVEYLDTKIEAVNAADGRLVAEYDPNFQTLSKFNAEFHLKDHLGNVRLSFIDINEDAFISAYDDPDTPENEVEITQENHYYPFGMNQNGDWYETVEPENRLKYNGKELTEDLDLNWLDYGARWYDPAIGRWNAVDPLAEKYSNWSPYNYVKGNPIGFIDPDGMRVSLFDKMEEMGAYHGAKPEDIIKVDKAGNVVEVTRTEEDNVFIDAESGEPLELNDPENADQELLTRTFEIGEQVYIEIADGEVNELLDNAGTEPYRLRSESLHLFKHLREVIKLSTNVGPADFPMQLSLRYNLETRIGGDRENRYYIEVLGPMFRFENSNTLYNPSDAGQYLWGAWMDMNRYYYWAVKTGSNLNEFSRGGDSEADQRAIKAGFYRK